MTSDYPWQEMPTLSFLLSVLILLNVLKGPFLKVYSLKKKKQERKGKKRKKKEKERKRKGKGKGKGKRKGKGKEKIKKMKMKGELLFIG